MLHLPRAAIVIALLLAALGVACSGGDDDEATATPTREDADGSAGDGEDIVLRFDEWDATITIPAGALPDGTSPDDITVEPLTPDTEEGRNRAPRGRFPPRTGRP